MGDGMSMLGVLALGGLLAGVFFNKLQAWAATWRLWVGANFGGAEADALNLLPEMMFLAQVLVILAAAMPATLTIRR